MAGAAALVAGTITGTQVTVEDPVWPERGGIEALVQICLMFTAYGFAVAVAMGVLASVTLAPLMARAGLTGAGPHVAAGLALGLAVHLLVDIAIRERIDGTEDWLGGTIAGAVAGLLWWFLSRHDLGTTSVR